jgi:hypothetical protein
MSAGFMPALGQVFSKYFGFPCQSLFHQLLHSHPHLSSGSGIIAQKWPQYKGLSPTPLAIKKLFITVYNTNNSFLKRSDTTMYITNCSPMKTVSATSEEAWARKGQSWTSEGVGLHKFVCIPGMKPTEWNKKSKEYIFMGYCETAEGQRFLDPGKPTDSFP